MAAEGQSTRERILQAAADLAWENGPGNISLDAVAAKAGVSKGGLLYHFPSKSKLLEATVETFVADYDRMLKAREQANSAQKSPVTHAFLELFLENYQCKQPASSGILAALAEDPSFLSPVQHYERVLLDRIKTDLPDPDLAIALYLMISGLKNSELLGMKVVKPEEVDRLIGRLRKMIASPSDFEKQRGITVA